MTTILCPDLISMMKNLKPNPNSYHSNIYSAYVDDQKILDYEQHKNELMTASDKEDFLDAVEKIEEYIQSKTV